MDIWKPTGVSFSGGGARTVGHLGVLSHLLSCDMLNKVRNWYGCSGGSFIAVLGAIGCSSSWIYDLVQHFDMSIFAGIDEELIVDFQSNLGVNSGNKLSGIMSKFIDTWEPGCSRWTFADLSQERPGVSLTITATNLTCGKLVAFNAQNTPDMLLIDAVRASCAIPLYFTPWRNREGEVFCDGGLIETYPWATVEDKANTLVVICSDTDICGRKERRTIASFGDYISALGNIIAKNKTVDTPRHWIAVNNSSVGFMDFHISTEIRFGLLTEGVAAAAAWNAFRLKALTPEKRGIPPPYVAPRTLSSCRPSPDKTSGSPQSQTPSQPPCRTQDLRSGRSRTARRWSL